MNDIPKQSNSDQSVKHSVIERIESEKINPIHRWQFMCSNSLVWLLWCSSVILGAMSLAVVLYVTTMSRHELFEATHESYIGFLISILPYVWLIILFGTAYFSYINFRNTKTGYRHPLWVVLGSSVLVSVLLGSVLYIGDFGKKIDNLFFESVPMYKSLEYKERMLWMSPEEGRLLGTLDYATNSRAYIADLTGKKWEINIEDMNEVDIRTLETKKTVRLIGFYEEVMPNHFHACGAFPWLYDSKTPIAISSDERKSFIERMYTHKDAITNRLEEIKIATYSTSSMRMPMGICATHTMVERISH